MLPACVAENCYPELYIHILVEKYTPTLNDKGNQVKARVALKLRYDSTAKRVLTNEKGKTIFEESREVRKGEKYHSSFLLDAHFLDRYKLEIVPKVELKGVRPVSLWLPWYDYQKEKSRAPNHAVEPTRAPEGARGSP